MVETDDRRHAAERMERLCTLLGWRNGPVRTRAHVQEAARRVLLLFRDDADPRDLLAAFDDLDDLLRVEGFAYGTGRGGLADAGRPLPGLPDASPPSEVFRCPGERPCTRIELPRRMRGRAPLCAAHGERMVRMVLRDEA
ncbi:hypothetical protein ACIBF1_43925 [Spirillospora sp. NPDC050679]